MVGVFNKDTSFTAILLMIMTLLIVIYIRSLDICEGILGHFY